MKQKKEKEKEKEKETENEKGKAKVKAHTSKKKLFISILFNLFYLSANLWRKWNEHGALPQTPPRARPWNP